MSCESEMDKIRYAMEDETPLDPCEMVKLIDIDIAKILAAMSSGEAVTYLEIRNRRVQYSDWNKTLQQLRQERIAYASACAASQPKRSKTNIGTFKRVN